MFAAAIYRENLLCDSRNWLSAVEQSSREPCRKNYLIREAALPEALRSIPLVPFRLAREADHA